MMHNLPAIFRGRHFEPEIIATCVRWYLRFSLSLPNVEEMMAERGLECDPRRNKLLTEGSKGDKADARKLAELLRTDTAARDIDSCLCLPSAWHS
jgi:hypothetical protein